MPGLNPNVNQGYFWIVPWVLQDCWAAARGFQGCKRLLLLDGFLVVGSNQAAVCHMSMCTMAPNVLAESQVGTQGIDCVEVVHLQVCV